MATGLFCKRVPALSISLAVGHKATEVGSRSGVWRREGSLLLYVSLHCLCFHYDHRQPW